MGERIRENNNHPDDDSSDDGLWNEFENCAQAVAVLYRNVRFIVIFYFCYI